MIKAALALSDVNPHGDGLFVVANLFVLNPLSLLRRTRLGMPFMSSDDVLAAELAPGKVTLRAQISKRILRETSTTLLFVLWSPLAMLGLCM